jgi:acyl dehydratase
MPQLPSHNAAPAPAAAAAHTQASGALQRTVLGQLLVPANAGRAFGGLTADRNPIHLCSATSQLFGFRQPIAHAMYLVARLEASLAEKGVLC